MLDRRAFMFGGLAALAAPRGAEVQKADKVYRVGYLSAGSRETSEYVLQS